MKRVLLVGAFERDNFGDILFYHVTKAYLKHFDVSPASIIYAAPSDHFAIEVFPYGDELNSQSYDYVWVVGGEVGGLSLSDAYRMIFSGTDREKYDSLSRDARAAFNDALGASSVGNVAYMPELSKSTMNQDAKLIFNSVGLSHVKEASADVKRDSKRILTSSYAISVREKSSLEFVSAFHSSVSLSPDLVHAASRIKESLTGDAPSLSVSKEYILVQMNEQLVKDYTVGSVVDTLCQLIEKYHLPVYLFAAGTAPHHDSIALYEEIQEKVKSRGFGELVEVIKDRDALTLLEYVKNTRLWIGTSLHGRILATTFHKNRISLKNSKVATYAKNWDPEYPYDVNLEDLIAATDNVDSLSESQIQKIDKNADELALRAENNITKIIKSL